MNRYTKLVPYTQMEYRSSDILFVAESKDADELSTTIKGLQGAPFIKAVVLKCKIDPSLPDFIALCQAIDSHPRIECLDISSYSSEFTTIEAQQLAEWLSKTKLKKLSFADRVLSSDAWKIMFDAISSNASITTLSLDYQDRDPEGKIIFFGAEQLIQTVRSNTTIKALNIRITTQNYRSKDLVNALLENKTIASVDLSGLLDSDTLTLQAILQQNSNLRTLHINDSMIKSEGLERINEALKVNNSLTSFGLIGNPVSDEGCQWILRMLHQSKLKELTLKNAGLTQQASRSILETVRNHRTLIKLSLACNELDPLSSLISDVLKVNTTLIELDITKCNLKGHMCIVAEGLKVNRTLQKLLIGDNDLHVQDTIDISLALRENKGLTALNMSKSNFLQHNSGYLCEAVERNKALIDVEANVKGWIYGYTSRLREALQRNRKHQNTEVVNRVIIVLNVARTKPQLLLPEIWTYIFLLIDMPGVHINWSYVLTQAFINPSRTNITKI